MLRSKHALDPFSNPGIAKSDDDDEVIGGDDGNPSSNQNRSIDSSISSSSSPSSPPLPPSSNRLSSSLRSLFHTTFPDSYTRLTFTFILVGIVACSAFWLNWIIESRWLQQKNHPTVTVTLEKLTNVPPMQGMGFVFPAYLFDMPLMLDQTLNTTTYASTNPPNNMGHYFQTMLGDVKTGLDIPIGSGDGVSCQMVQQRNKSFVCQPSKNGQNVYGSNSFEQPLPDLTDPEVWSYQLRSVTDQLCFQIWSFLDVGPVLEVYNTTQFPYKLPFLQSYNAAPETIVQVNHWLETSDRSDESFLPVVDTLPGVFIYSYNKYHVTSLTVSKYIPLNGQEELTYATTNRDTIDMTDGQVEVSFEAFKTYFPQDYERLDAWRKESPSHQMFFINYCLRITDMHALVSKEVNTYGFLPFLSDLGGFLSMLMFLIGILFPIVTRVTEPRRFLPLVLFGQKKNDQIQGDLNTMTTTTTPTTTTTNMNVNDLPMKTVDNAGVPMTTSLPSSSASSSSDAAASGAPSNSNDIQLEMNTRYTL